MPETVAIYAEAERLRGLGYTVNLTVTAPGTVLPLVRRETDSSELFEEAWKLYPKRPGASKQATLKAWNARIKAGKWAVDMLEGVKRYAAYVVSEGTEPQYIKQPATFLGPGLYFEADWTVKKAGPAQFGKAGSVTARNAQDWLRGDNHGA